jgi:DNA polymerase-3 subunit epsilon
MKHWKTLSKDGQTITLKKFDGVFRIPSFVNSAWIESNHKDIARGAVVDVETTGLGHGHDRVIEIGVRTFRFHKTGGHLVSLEASYEGLQDPGFPLSADITEITGITDQDVKGKNIDWAQVKLLLDHSEIVIAHNAGFDRPFIEKELGEPTDQVWACSFKQIDWTSKGFGIQKLEILSAYHGFFADAHRALNDVDALLNLLIHADDVTGKSYLAELFANSRRNRTKVIAIGAPFESKDLLKSKGYRWDPEARAWNKVIYQDLLGTELDWMKSVVYRGEFRGKLVEIPVEEQFRRE